jgi:cytosine/adenosine deaminase-related metal-dependent hydrolase
LVNARFGDGSLGSVRVVGARIAALNALPKSHDMVVDLGGDRLLPGLINAHDHLQLNSLPRHAGSARYPHARDWISEVDSRRRTDAEFEASVTVPRDDRLLLGGIKNLLSGVTTVAHHDPLYPSLLAEGFPIAVLQDFGWSHSLYIDGDEKVAASFRNTPPQWPWIIHAAEGVNSEAADEFTRLEAMGCVHANSVLVHGIALDAAQRQRLDRAGAGLIWCPSSNLNLYGSTAEVRDLRARGRVALGTDSRLSGSRDLLDELRVAVECIDALGIGTALGAHDPIVATELEALVTRDAAKLLRLSDRGEIRAGLRADLVVLPATSRLGTARRSQLRLVMVGGVARYGDAECAEALVPAGGWHAVAVDGIPKLLDGSIATRLSQARAAEAGLQLSNVTWRAA